MEEKIKYTEIEGSTKYIKKTGKTNTRRREDTRMNESNKERLCEAHLLN
jgi:hypothetical protein